MASRSSSIGAQLRQAIRRAEARGVTRYQISQRSGVSQALLVKFYRGEGNPRLDTAEAIAGAIGLKLILTPGRRTSQ